MINKKLTKGKRREERVGTAVAKTRLTRRAFVGAATGGLALLVVWERMRPKPRLEALGEVTVFTSPGCQCCGRWVERMREHGFRVAVQHVTDVSPVKREHGVPPTLYSCHTGLVGGYTIEGHVPPDLVARVLREGPAIAGLAVPGMPQSAPGMDLGHEAYDVLLFDQSGRTTVYASR